MDDTAHPGHATTETQLAAAVSELHNDPASRWDDLVTVDDQLNRLLDTRCRDDDHESVVAIIDQTETLRQRYRTFESNEHWERRFAAALLAVDGMTFKDLATVPTSLWTPSFLHDDLPALADGTLGELWRIWHRCTVAGMSSALATEACRRADLEDPEFSTALGNYFSDAVESARMAAGAGVRRMTVFDWQTRTKTGPWSHLWTVLLGRTGIQCPWNVPNVAVVEVPPVVGRWAAVTSVIGPATHVEPGGRTGTVGALDRARSRQWRNQHSAAHSKVSSELVTTGRRLRTSRT